MAGRSVVKLIDEGTPSHSFPDTEKKQQVPFNDEQPCTL